MSDEARSNGLAIAGFVLALCALVLSWVPFFNVIMWVLSIVFSGIGLSRAGDRGDAGRGLAIAGLAISLGAIALSILVLFGLFIHGSIFIFP